MKRAWIIILILMMVIGNFGHELSFAEGESILRIGVKQEPDSLNPFVSYESASYEIFMIVYDSLTMMDRNLDTVPALAKSWELSDDQLTWTFHLNENVKWHDGVDFTAEDVKYTYEAFQETEMGMYYGSISDITNINIIDDYTIEMKTELPKANMLQNVTPILPAHIWKDLDIDELSTFENNEMVGTGPFKFLEWQKNQQLVFEANKDYFVDTPKVDNLIFVIFANNDTMVQSIQNGEIDVALGLDYVDIKNALSNEDIKNYSYEENGFTQLAFNSSESSELFNPLIKNKEIRHAFEYAIDKQKIVDLVYDSAAEPGTSYLPPSQNQWHYEPDSDELRTYNLEKAIQILTDAGFSIVDDKGYRSNTAGEKLSFVLLSRSENISEVKVGQMIQSDLKAVGVEIKIETVDDGVLYDRTMSTLDYDMFIWGWGGDVDPTVLLNVLTTDNIGNLNDVFYSNPEYDAIVLAQSREMNLEKRMEMVKEAQKILYEDLPYSILYYSNNNQLVRSDLVSGLEPTSSGAVFYASTNANYIDASLTVSESEESNMLLIGLGAVAIVAVVVVYIVSKKKIQKKNSEKTSEKW